MLTYATLYRMPKISGASDARIKTMRKRINALEEKIVDARLNGNATIGRGHQSIAAYRHEIANLQADIEWIERLTVDYAHLAIRDFGR